MTDVEVVGEEKRSKGTTVWMPPGIFDEPPTDRRRWNALLTTGTPPWTRTFVKAMQNPGRWQLLCVSQRPEGVCWRIRQGEFGATKHGVWEATQRSLGNGWSRVWVMCSEPPPSVPGDEP